MNIAIAARFIAFESGSQNLLQADLEQRLLNEGHKLHQMRLPVKTASLQAFSQSFLALRSLKIMNADCLVVLDPVLAMLQHANKVGCFVADQSTNTEGEAFASRLAACRSEFKHWLLIERTENGRYDIAQLSNAIETITTKTVLENDC